MPTVALGGAAGFPSFDTDAFQEYDQLAMAKPVTRWVSRVTSADRMPEYFNMAYRQAQQGKPGPTYLVGLRRADDRRRAREFMGHGGLLSSVALDDAPERNVYLFRGRLEFHTHPRGHPPRKSQCREAHFPADRPPTHFLMDATYDSRGTSAWSNECGLPRPPSARLPSASASAFPLPGVAWEEAD